MNTRAIHPILIIGAGPAGIATAIEVIKRGYEPGEVVLIERSGEVANMIVTKYPDEKPVLANYKERMAECLGDLCIQDMSKQEFLRYMQKTIELYQLQINFHEQAETILKLHNGQFFVKTNRDTYICNAIFVAVGNMSAPRTLGVGVHEKVTAKLFYDLQGLGGDLKKVLVVGGGDSAAEYAKVLIDRGHEVVMSYRGEDFSRMLPVNKEITMQLIRENKLRFLPASHLDHIDQGERANPVAVFKEATYGKMDFDAVVTALGTERPTKYLASLGITALIESADGQTEHFTEAAMDGIFLVGDLASGKKGGSINFAFNSGTLAVAKACSLYLDCQ